MQCQNTNPLLISHPEFEGRVDISASCPGQLDPAPEVYESGDMSHGTAIASIVGAAGDNGDCGVGIAPLVTLSGCRFSDSQLSYAEMLAYNLETFDISQNSWGVESCQDQDRRLQEKECPFKFEESTAYPCDYCDFSAIQQGTNKEMFGDFKSISGR
jgi:hypothetical protein